MEHCVVNGTGRVNITDHYNVRARTSQGHSRARSLAATTTLMPTLARARTRHIR